MKSFVLRLLLGLAYVPALAQAPQRARQPEVDLRASFEVQNRSSGELCMGTWLSREGHAIIPRNCLKVKNTLPYEGHELSYMQIPELKLSFPKLLVLGSRSIYLTLQQLAVLSEQELYELQESGQFVGDSNYALLKFNVPDEQKMKVNCAQISLKRIQQKEDLLVIQSKKQKTYNHFRAEGTFGLQIKSWRSDYFKAAYATPYSAIARNMSVSNPLPGATVFSEEGYIHGMVIYIQGYEYYYKVISFGDIFEKFAEKLSPKVMDTIYSCTLR